MLYAFSRLLNIALAVIACFIFVVFGLRWLGSTQRYAPLEHPFASRFVVVDEIKVLVGENGEWHYLVGEEIQPLVQWQMNEHVDGVWFDIIARTGETHLKLLQEFVRERGLENKVIVSSPYQKIVRDMRKLEPLWLYGASTAENAKARFLTSLYLETMATLEADIFINDKIASRLASELHKRHKRIFAKTKSVTEAQTLVDAQNIDGAIVSP